MPCHENVHPRSRQVITTHSMGMIETTHIQSAHNARAVPETERHHV